jgi:hypothetical protein
MAQPPEDLTLGAGLIKKGEGRGVSPALAVPPPVRMPELPASQTMVPDEADPPLRAVPPDDVPKRFTSFRLPVELDEELRAMVFETRRSKQDLLIEFVTAGVRAWRRERARR